MTPGLTLDGVIEIEAVPAEVWSEWVEANDGVLLDVREPNEWAQGTLPDALLIPVSELMSRMSQIPTDRAVLCVCRSGDRSHQVAAFLKFNGYDGVANMIGGMKALGMQR